MSDTALTPIDGLTVKEAAHRLRVAPKTIYSWCSDGKIVYFKIMGSIRIRKEDLDSIKEDIF